MSNQPFFSLSLGLWRALLALGVILALGTLSPARQPLNRPAALAQGRSGWANPTVHAQRGGAVLNPDTDMQMQAGAGVDVAIEASPSGSASLASDIDVAAHPGGRDPFKLPPPPLPSRAKGGDWRPANLPPGVRGLIISGLKLEGVVSENSGREMIAVVTNESNRAYFLRTNEQLYDGAVTRITPQAVFFTERVRDRHGRESIQAVVKRLNPKPGDGQ